MLISDFLETDRFRYELIETLRLDWREDNKGFRLFSDYLDHYLPMVEAERSAEEEAALPYK